MNLHILCHQAHIYRAVAVAAGQSRIHIDKHAYFHDFSPIGFSCFMVYYYFCGYV